MKWILFLVFVALRITNTVQNCENETKIVCPRQNMTCAKLVCSCSADSTNITCINVLDDIPADIPQKAEYFTMRGNNLTTVKAGAFGGLHYLIRLDLLGNKIENIEPGAFADLPRLSVINLDGNLIRTLRMDSFKDLPVQNLNFGGIPMALIESRAFNNLPNLNRISIWSTVTKIQTEAFYNLSSLTSLDLQKKYIVELEERAFLHLPKLESIFLYDNLFTVINENTFCNFPALSSIYIQNTPVKEIKENAFCNLPSLTSLVLSKNSITSLRRNSFRNLPAIQLLSMHDNLISLIENDAFLNVRAGALWLGIEKDFVMNENAHSNFTSIYFRYQGSILNHLNCNCSFMWFSLWSKDYPEATFDGFCTNLNKSVDKLVIDDFSFCYDQIKPVVCNVSQSIEIKCTSRYITSYFKHWVHTENGTEIRKLSGQSIDDNTSSLSIAHCNYQDVGDYTCIRRTNYSALAEFALLTMKLYVYGPPILLRQLSRYEGNNLILSVVFYCDPYNEPEWLLGDMVLSTGSEYIITTTSYPVALNESSRRMYKGFKTNLAILNYKQFSSIQYKCIVNNGFGEVEERITISVNIQISNTTICDTSQTAEIKCTIDFMGAIPDAWIHSSGEQMVRKLSGTVVNTTYILLIPFCNYQDMGDYTCIWKTQVPGFSFNKTTTLVVNGPPFSLQQEISRDGNDTILSVFFFSQPFPTEPKWFFMSTPVALGLDYQQTTTFSNVTVRQHKHDIIRQGFVTSLTIVNSKSEFYGDYSCKIVNNFGYIQENIKARAPSLDHSTTDGVSTIIIVTASVGAVVVLTTIFLIVAYKRRKQKNDGYMDTPVPYSSSETVYDSIGLSGEHETTAVYTEVY